MPDPDRWQMSFSEWKSRGLQIVQSCEDHVFSWSRGARHSNSQSCPASPKHVRFQDQVEVVIVGDCDDRAQYSAGLEDVQILNRTLWHLDGQCATGHDCICIARTWQPTSVPSESLFSSIGSCICRYRPSLQRTHTQDVARFTQELPDLLCQFLGDSRIRISNLISQAVGLQQVEVWYLDAQRRPLTVAARKMPLRSVGSVPELARRCIALWYDVVDPEQPVFFQVVHPKPESCLTTVAHIIMTQNCPDNHVQYVIKSDAFSESTRFRALTVEAGVVAVEVFEAVQHPAHCDGENIACFVSMPADDHQVATWDVVPFPSATFLLVEAWVVQNTDSDDTPTTGAEDVASPRSASEDDTDDDDEVALTMTTMSVIWPPPEPVVPLQEPNEQELGTPDTEIHAEEWPPIQDHLQAMEATSADDQSYFQVVTFGLGLVGLGRRDRILPFTRMDELLPAVLDLWDDHARYGVLQVHLVRPQPTLVQGLPHIVLIVVVELQGTFFADRVPVLIHQHSDEPVLHLHQPHAEWLPRYFVPTDFLMVTQLTTMCVPEGMREYALSCGGTQVVGPGNFVAEPGDYCHFVVQPYPPHIAVQAQLLFGAEQFHRELRDRRNPLVRPFPPTSCTVVVHGISPANRPLGSRLLVLQFQHATEIDWIVQARELWHFEGHECQLAFSHWEMQVQTDSQDYAYFVHFVASFHGVREMIPVLFTQTLATPIGATDHCQHLAVCIPEQATQREILRGLPSPPFWLFQDVPCVLRYAGHILDANPYMWTPGSLLQFQIVAPDTATLLHTILETSERGFPAEVEYTSFLQTHVKVDSSHVESTSPRLVLSKMVRKEFGIADWDFRQQNAPNPDDKALQPEGNLGLRSRVRDHQIDSCDVRQLGTNSQWSTEYGLSWWEVDFDYRIEDVFAEAPPWATICPPDRQVVSHDTRSPESSSADLDSKRARETFWNSSPSMDAFQPNFQQQQKRVPVTLFLDLVIPHKRLSTAR